MRLGTFSNSGLGFGLAFSLVDDFTFTARRIEREMQKLSGASAALAASVEASMAKAKLGAAGLLVSLIGLAGWAAAAKQDAIFQNFELAFRSFLSSAEEAHRVFEQIKQQAIANPKFSIEGMEKANLLLISQGVEANKSMQSIQDLTTVLLGVGRGEAELSRVALAFEKIQAAGFLTGPQFRSLTTAGLPVVAMLKAIGVNLDPSHIAAAKISFETLTKALHNSTLQGQQFGRVWEMMNGNISAMAAQIKENWAATLGDIGKAIRPVTEVVLKAVSAILNRLREFAGTDLGKWVFRFLLALNLLVFALSAMILVSALGRISLMHLAGAFGATTKASVLTALASGKVGGAFGIMGKAALNSAAGLGKLVAQFALFYLGYKLVSETDSGFLYALGTALMFALGPLGVIAAAFMFVKRSIDEFNHVLDGSAAPAQGFIGVLQRIGATLKFIGAAWQGFSYKNGEIEISKSLMVAMNRVGLGKFATDLATWIGRIHASWDGLVEGFKEGWGIFTNMLLSIVNFFRPVNDQLASWDDLIDKNTDSMIGWKEQGKKWGKVMAALFVGVLAALALIAVSLTLNAFLGAISFLAWSAPILLVIGLIGLLLIVINDIANALDGTKDYADNGFTGMSDAANTTLSKLGMLNPEFADMGHQWGSSLVKGMQTAMGDWWERFSSMDFSWWGKENGYYHYVPGAPERSGYIDPRARSKTEIQNSTNNRTLSNAVTDNGGITSPYGAAAGMLQYQSAWLNTMNGVRGNMQKEPQKAKPVTINLNIDSRTVAKAIVDTAKYENATQYNDPTLDPTGSSYLGSVNAGNNGQP